MRSKILGFGLAFTIMLMLGMVGTPAVQGQAFTVLYTFTGGSDSEHAHGPVVDRNGNVYGTTTNGPYDCGTVWKVSRSGSHAVLHAFSCSDGSAPGSGVSLDREGNLFGTTASGGLYGKGTAFMISASGTFATIYNFGSLGAADPSDIEGGVAFGPSDNLYGTSFEGGAFGSGTVWKLSSTGSESILHSFGCRIDGCEPEDGSLHRDKAGNLFGVASEDGSGSCGTLFEIKSGGKFMVLHRFYCRSDSRNPTGTLLEYKGNLYGTTAYGGIYDAGTVWKYNIHNGKFTVLHKFSGPDGSLPIGGVACQLGKKTVCAGNLFGTTHMGGASGNGTAWEIDSRGTFRLLHSFSYSDGTAPWDRPFVDRKGNVYGTTIYGGDHCDCGTVWKITFP